VNEKKKLSKKLKKPTKEIALLEKWRYHPPSRRSDFFVYSTSAIA